jgi:hypothetical protein
MELLFGFLGVGALLSLLASVGTREWEWNQPISIFFSVVVLLCAIGMYHMCTLTPTYTERVFITNLYNDGVREIKFDKPMEITEKITSYTASMRGDKKVEMKCPQQPK